MEKQSGGRATQMIKNLGYLLQKCIFSILSVGSVPNHIAFIMDGNRRYAKKHTLAEESGHSVGFLALMNMLKYCYELGVKYVTIYAFSIDNFKRRPEEVQSIMTLMQEKIDGLLEEESLVNCYGVRVNFIGNLELLDKPIRLAAKRAMAATAHNSKAVLSICLAYASGDEIVHAVQESCEEKCHEMRLLYSRGVGYGVNEIERRVITVTDLEKHMHMSVAPDPDIIIRTSGETRLSNFLLWQSAHCLLYSPSVLWPEIGVWHLVWAVLLFQRHSVYLKVKKWRA